MSRQSRKNILQGSMLFAQDIATEAYSTVESSGIGSTATEFAKYSNIVQAVSDKVGLARLASTIGVASAAHTVTSALTRGYSAGSDGAELDVLSRLKRTASGRVLSILTEAEVGIDEVKKGEIVAAATKAVSVALAASSLHIDTTRDIAGEVVGHFVGSIVRSADSTSTSYVVPPENILSPRSGYTTLTKSFSDRLREQRLAARSALGDKTIEVNVVKPRYADIIQKKSSGGRSPGGNLPPLL